MMRVSGASIIVCVFLFLFSSIPVFSQNAYELRQLTDEDWVGMTTEERLKAIGTSNSQAVNQTFVGSFGRYSDLAQKWGYDYYEMDDSYQNYSFRGFENYNIVNDRRNRQYYNQFGDRLTKMRTDANLWKETYNDDGSSYINRTSNYINSYMVVDGIWVARESTDDWAVSVVGADALRAKYTPLTFSIPNLTGMKADFQSANYSASFLNSIVIGNTEGSPRYSHQYNPGSIGSFGTTSTTLMLRGGQFRRKFGALTLGATYVNMFSMQASRKNGSGLEGHVSDHAPTPLRYLLRVVDDSPHDGNGPIVHDVKLKINGAYRPDIIPTILLDDINRELQTAVYSLSQYRYMEYPQKVNGRKNDNEITNIYKRAPKYLDYMYMEDYKNGWNSSVLGSNFDIDKANEYYTQIDPGGKPVQVNGSEYVVYIFNISSVSENITSVEADVTVSNDYRIDSATIFNTILTGRDDTSSDYRNNNDATYWYTQAQADGNVKDGSNIRTVTVDFGFEVANIIYGFDAHFNYLGFKVDGEFVVNQRNFMFADGYAGRGINLMNTFDLTAREGKRSSRSDNAYYVTIQKEWDRFSFAGELFKMGKFYSPEYMYFNHRDVSGKHARHRNNYLRMTMIEDNDDNDQYPDNMPFNMAMGSFQLSTYDPDGVFPGNDLDRDSIPDTDRNYNAVPDYDEPFLMLDVDPDEFVFGDDINNNSVPDFREDDIKYDTPYDLDRQGHHLNLKFVPQEHINIVLGTIRQRGIGLDTRSDDDYMKLGVNYNVLSVGSLYGEYRFHRIQDNIQDVYLTPVPTPLEKILTADGRASRYTANMHYDEVEYRNSSVNKLFLESKIRAVPSLILESHIKYERNFRIEGTSYDNVYQAEDIINTLAVSSKLIYTKQWGNLSLSPGFKYRTYKKAYLESLNPRRHFVMQIPMIIMKYRISSKTNISLGFQGFKGFEYHYRDLIQSQNNFRQRNILLQVENKTIYFGFEVWGGFGFQLEDHKFDEEYRKFENYKTSSLFVRMWIGFE
ncbi:hypothetical protein ACFL2X_04380 [Candidatus Latescibacterota bacterium]